MKITLADHYGMCFGVRDALQVTGEVAAAGPTTVLGDLVHNGVVQRQLAALGVKRGSLAEVGASATERVIITAHGAAEGQRRAWRDAGFAVTDTTCPLVRKAHRALAQLVAGGARAVVIGQAGHAEVRGLCGDFPEVAVVESAEEVEALGFAPRFGVVAQTTQPLGKVLDLVECLRRRHPGAEVVYRDTVCQPTKDRQSAMERLVREQECVVVVGGRHSNNTRQLSETARRAGVAVRQVETAEELQAAWFAGVTRVGVTAGTSTLEETVQAVVTRLEAFGNGRAEEAAEAGAGGIEISGRTGALAF